MSQVEEVTDNLSAEDSDLSPTEFIAKECFPLRDFELVKIYDYHIKILDDLGNIYRGIQEHKDPPICADNSEEALKMQRRASEFSTRFSRNHLYPLRRETRQVFSALHSTKHQKRGYSEILRKKMTTAYQTALQAVSTYISFSSLPNNLPVYEKLKELITEVHQLHEICENILIPIQGSVGHGSLDMLPNKCQQIKEALEKPVVIPVPLDKPKSKKKNKDLNVNSSLAMYEPKLGNWSMKSQALARLKFGQMVKARRRKNAKVPSEETQKHLEKRNPSCARSSRSRETLAKKRRDTKNEVVPEDDVETEIQRFDLRSAKTQENIPPLQQHKPPSTARSELHSLVQEALNDLNIGDEASALVKIQQIRQNAADKSPSLACNVGVFHFRSEEPDTTSDSDPMVEEKVSGETNSKYLFELAESKRKQFKPLNISAEFVEQCVRYKKAKDQETEHLHDDKPWEIVSSVSDLLVDNLLDDVLEEMLDDEMVTALYQSELQNI